VTAAPTSLAPTASPATATRLQLLLQRLEHLRHQPGLRRQRLAVALGQRAAELEGRLDHGRRRRPGADLPQRPAALRGQRRRPRGPLADVRVLRRQGQLQRDLTRRREPLPVLPRRVLLRQPRQPRLLPQRRHVLDRRQRPLQRGRLRSEPAGPLHDARRLRVDRAPLRQHVHHDRQHRRRDHPRQGRPRRSAGTCAQESSGVIDIKAGLAWLSSHGFMPADPRLYILQTGWEITAASATRRSCSTT
jgi:hypothetical protein